MRFTASRTRNGNVEYLALQTYRIPSDGMLDHGDVVAIKESYYCLSVGGFTQVLVANPADLLTLKYEDARMPQRFRSLDSDSEKTALQLKIIGNHKFKARRYSEAVELYSKGLDGVEETYLWLDLCRNRALANLHMGQFDAAKSDALAAILVGDDLVLKLNAKAYYHAGRASCGLGRFEEARDFFLQHLQLLSESSDGKKQITELDRRTSEQNNGYYRFKTIVDDAVSGCFTGRGDFTGHVQVRQTANRGRGLFATKAFNTGVNVVCETATFVSRRDDPGVYDTVMYHDVKDNWKHEVTSCGHKGLIQKLVANPSLIPRVASLCAGPSDTTTSTPTPPLVDNQPVLHAYQIHKIVATNCFSVPSLADVHTSKYPFCAVDGSGGAGKGLWCTISQINHSCTPNVAISFVGNVAIVRACRDIAAGDEIRLSYVCPENLEERQSLLKQTWGFECDCELCQADVQIPADVRARRPALLQQLSSLTAKADSDVAAMNRIIDELETTYDPSVYASLPKSALAKAYTMLARFYKQQDFAGERTTAALFSALEAEQVRLKEGQKAKTHELEDTPRALKPTVIENLVELFRCNRIERPTVLHIAMYLYSVLNGHTKGFEFVAKEMGVQAPRTYY